MDYAAHIRHQPACSMEQIAIQSMSFFLFLAFRIPLFNPLLVIPYFLMAHTFGLPLFRTVITARVILRVLPLGSGRSRQSDIHFHKAVDQVALKLPLALFTNGRVCCSTCPVPRAPEDGCARVLSVVGLCSHHYSAWGQLLWWLDRCVTGQADCTTSSHDTQVTFV